MLADSQDNHTTPWLGIDRVSKKNIIKTMNKIVEQFNKLLTTESCGSKVPTSLVQSTALFC
jgi:hypothetical protein